jgi:hypothetical protein
MAVGPTIFLVGGTGQQGAAAAGALTPRGESWSAATITIERVSTEQCRA